MRHARIFLSLTLAFLWLASGAGLAVPIAGSNATGQAAGSSLSPGGLTPAEWQTIQAQLAKLTADDGAEYNSFGPVSVSGDTAVVGAPGAGVGGNSRQGAAYVFYRNQGGRDAWGQVAKLTAADGAVEDTFGWSVSLSGDTALVGACQADLGGQGNEGAAYVFYRNQGGPDAWGQFTKLTAADSAVHWFGQAVSLNGDVAIVGAPETRIGSNYDQGAAYVFYRNQGGPDAWGQAARLTAADGAMYDFFGKSASVSGDTAIVGSRGAKIGDHQLQGAAYVFYRNRGGPDAWGQVAKLTAADGVAFDFLGESVSVDGDTAIVGAAWADVGSNSDQGAAYVFYRNQGGADVWGQVAKLTAADSAANDLFGWSVSLSCGTAVVGAREADISGNADQGAAYIFYRNQGGVDAWGEVAKLTAADGAESNYFGYYVSINSNTAIVGAPTADIGGHDAQGAAYVYGVWPVGQDDAHTTAEDTPLQVPAVLGVLANDLNPCGNVLTAVLDSTSSHGTLALHVDGSFIYTPTANYNGLDSFTYHANIGSYNSKAATVTIAVTAVNDAPVAANDAYSTPIDWPLTVAVPGVLLNDSDVEDDPLTAMLDGGPSHGTLNLQANGSFTYAPTAGFAGVDTFTYHLNDGKEDSNIATVQITVAGHGICLPLVLRNY